MIEVRGVAKAFGPHRVLRDASFALEPGERAALLGVNGAGKTTLLRCILGLVSYDGSIRVDGLDARTRGVEARRRLGYVPQRAPVSNVSTGDFVHLVSDLREVSHARVRETLASLGLSLDREAAKPLDALSGGMLQKTLLGLVLADRPPVLLLDEPTASLDPGARREFLDGIGRVSPDTTLLLASHRLEDVQALTDRILVLEEGRVAFDGGVNELRSHADAPGSLWIQVSSRRRDEARRVLEALSTTLDVRLNGAGHVQVRCLPRDRASSVVAVRRAGIDVEDVRTEEEPLERILGRLAEKTGGRAGPGGKDGRHPPGGES